MSSREWLARFETADREPFQNAAMEANRRMPGALIGLGTVYRAVKLA
jgi:hypothetical protein